MSTQSHNQTGNHDRGFGPADPTDPATEQETGYLRWLRDALDHAEGQCSATAEAWRGWAAELTALTARMPTLPALPDAEGDGARAVERDGIDPDTLRAALAGPVRAADHFAAVYARHAEGLADALADVLADLYPPPTDLPTRQPTDATAAAGATGGAW